MSLEQAAEAEKQLRLLIAEKNLRDPSLVAFLSHLPTMRMSDLVGYLVDPEALAKALELRLHKRVVNDAEEAHLIAFAAIFAIKDEIDRRFPLQARTP